jgi:phosphoribosylaminoimidazole-succinocarboxamide synthase
LTKNSTGYHNSTKEKTEKDISLDGNNYLFVEYQDFIEDDKKTKKRIKGLGEKYASINSFFLEYIKEYHIPVAYVKNLSESVLKFIDHEKFPFFIRIKNAADKRTAKIFNKKEFEPLNLPLFEFHYGNGKDTLVSESHLISFDLCTYEELKLINRICSKVNAVLKSFFERRGELLAEMNCYFGKAEDKIYVTEDFTPKSLKIIPMEVNNKSINPFKLTTPALVRKYTDHLFTLTSS